jgi:hypothetical protein
MIPYKPKKSYNLSNKDIAAEFIFKKAEYWVLKNETPKTNDKI